MRPARGSQTEKFCARCQRTLTASAFNRVKSGRKVGMLRHPCKACAAADCRAYAAAHKKPPQPRKAPPRKVHPEIPLMVKRARELIDYNAETGILVRRISYSNNQRVGSRAGTQSGNGYRHVAVDGRNYLEHRFIWFWMTGTFPPADIDHANGDPTDNRWRNLRAATRSQNMANQAPRPGTTKGVTFDGRRGRWVAWGRVNNTVRFLGSFKTEAEAAACRRAWAEATFGEFSREGKAA